MQVVGLLDGAEVDYALVGGLAVGVWGAPRATKDIDLLVQAQDVIRAQEALRPAGYTLDALPKRFTDGMQLQRINKLADGQLSTVDLIVVDESLAPVWASCSRHATEVGSLSVESRDGLIAMKLAAGRPQDQAAVIRLQELDR